MTHVDDLQDGAIVPHFEGTRNYVFAAEKFDGWAEEEVSRLTSFAERAGWDPAAAEERIAARKQELARLRDWSEKYSGRVPDYWSQGEVAPLREYVLAAVGDTKVYFTNTMTDAALDYPDHEVVVLLGQERILDYRQLDRIRDRVTANEMAEINARQGMLEQVD